MIGESDKIDFLVTDKEKTHVILVITDHLDWEEFDEGHHLELLQEKINTYLFYAVDSGQLAENRPNLSGLPVHDFGGREICAQRGSPEVLSPGRKGCGRCRLLAG